MRILQMVHDFLPLHVAGVEVYTDNLSRRLARDHEVAILYSEVVPEEPNYTLRRGRRDKVLTYEIVNNHRLANFEQTYRNPHIDQRIEEVLDEFAPDVVHIQHLINLSVESVQRMRGRGIPMVMTLHDHWLECANGGQRFHRELGRCVELDAARCGQCTAHMNGAGLGARGFFRRRSAATRRSGALPFLDLDPRVESPSDDFVYRDAYHLNGVPTPTLVAHPPTRLRYEVETSEGGRFTAAIAMHPSTFSEDGGGVRFRVHVNGDTRIDQVLDPKGRAADRHPARVEAEIEAGKSVIELETDATPPHGEEYCTAGWIEPRVVPHGGSADVPARAFLRPLKHVARLAARLPASAQARRVQRRWDYIRKLPEAIDLFVSPSRYLRDEFLRFGFAEDRVMYSDYGFQTEGFSKRTDLPEVARRFAFIGSLVPHKGVHVLLDAFAAMPEDATLDICGSPDYDPSYTDSLVRMASHPGIHFRGGLPPEQIAAFQQTVDCQIVPSIWNENSPLTIHEGFLSGVPVIASRRGGSTELLADGGGLVYDADDAQDLYRQLCRLYDEPGLARALAASAPPVKTMGEQVAELVPIYEELCKKAGARHVRA